MRQDQTNILNTLQDLRDSIEGPDEENEGQPPDQATNKSRQLNHTTTAANTQQDPIYQHRQSKMDTYQQFLKATVLEYQYYYTISTFVTPVKPVSVRAFATHPLYPTVEYYQ